MKKMMLLAAMLLPAFTFAQSPVRDVDTPALNPLRFSGKLDPLVGATTAVISFDVPAGKRFTVEYLNIFCQPQGNNAPAIYSYSITAYDSTTPFSDGPEVELIPSKTSQGYYNFANVMRLYADHSAYTSHHSIQVGVAFTDKITFNGKYYCNVVVSGSTVNLPVQ